MRSFLAVLASLLLGCLLVAWLAPGGSAVRGGAVDESSVERRLNELADLAQARTADGDEQAVLEILRSMAGIDPQHPKLYLQLVRLEQRRNRLDRIDRSSDELGLPAGPGRHYAASLADFFQRKRSAATERMKEALGAYESVDHLPGMAACHTALGIMARVRRDYGTAKAEYESARELQTRVGDPRSLADILGNLAGLERRTGNPALAVERQREILAIREQLGDRAGQGRSWHAIGLDLRKLEDPTGAVAAFTRALAIRRELRATQDAVATLREMARAREAGGDLAGAAADLEQARRLAVDLDDPRLGADTCALQGQLELRRGHRERAIVALTGAAGGYHAAGAHDSEAAARTRIAATLVAGGEFRGARRQLMPSLAEVDSFAGTPTEASLRTEASLVLATLGEPTDALLQLERALELHRQANDRKSEHDALNRRGVLYHYLGDRERARRDVEAALQIAEELDDAGAVARGANNLGILCFQTGQLDRARELYDRARRLFEQSGDKAGVASVRANLAELLAAERRFEESAAELVGALAIFGREGDRRNEASLLNQRGELERTRGRAEAARDAHQQALELARAHGVPQEIWRADAGLAAAYADLGRRDLARTHALRVLDGVETVRARLEIGTFKARFLANRIRHYEQALELTGRDDVAASFRLAERAPARALLDLLAESRSRMRDAVVPQLRGREEQLLDEVSAASVALASAENRRAAESARRRLTRARESLERHKIEVRRQVPRYGALVYPDPVELATFRERTLRPDEVLLQYFVGTDRAWLWVVRHDGVEQLDLPHPREIGERVREFLEAIQGSPSRLGPRRPELAAGARLARAVLPPLLPEDARLLLVAPDGPLHHVPFEALRVGDRFLIERHAVTMVPSATVLALLRDQPPASGDSLLAVADPQPVVGDWPALPYARQEVQQIAELFPPGQRTLLLAEQATKSDLRRLDLSRFGYLHFATHGWLDGSDLRQTGLLLSAQDEAPGAGLLALDEVVELSLSARTVVLSACRSGLGELLRGEGLVGLTGAFLYAGADSVLVSLWNVEDRATSDLMQRFYLGVRDGSDPAEALRQAKLELIASGRRSGSLVQRWAPFVLVGAPGSPVDE